MSWSQVENRFGFWFVFGESRGGVDISDQGGDVLVGVEEQLAHAIVRTHRDLMGMIEEAIAQGAEIV
jgi:hypothetical protein